MPDESGNTTVEELTSTPLPDDESPVEELEEQEAEEETETPEPTVEETEIEEALNLYRAIKDPKKQTAAISALAKAAGLLNEVPQNRTEEAAVKKDIKSLLKEKLGDLGFLADRLGPVLDEIIGNVKTETRQQFAQLTQKNLSDEIVIITAKLNKETNGEFKKLEGEMNRLADKVLPSKNMSTEEYMRTLYTLATAGKKVDPKTVQQRIERNRTNAADNIKSTPTRAGESAFDPNKKYSLKESIEIAAKQQTSNKGKPK